MQQYLAGKPFDLYALHLFHLVVKHRSFTQAARVAGLSGSALTRQIQALEQRLGLVLLNRTTRSVQVTEAGEYLSTEAARLTGNVASVLDGLQAAFTTAKPQVRVAVARSMAMAHMPGLFHANRQRHPEVICKINYQSSSQILTALDEGETDLGVLCPPPRLPKSAHVTHRFRDAFELIAPAALAEEASSIRRRDRLHHWLHRQSWLSISSATNTGQALVKWQKRQHVYEEPMMELDSFDLMINLVVSGYGLAWVPRRALALYRRKESWGIVSTNARFEREIVVVTRKQRRLPLHVSRFVENILF